jgi:hypothetical protein
MVFANYNPKHGIMTMKKHVINGLDLMKCLVHKCALEGRNNGK